MADDITQETFIRLMKKFHLYDQSKPIEPWIYRMTVNVTRNMLRKQKILSFVTFGSEKTNEEVENTILKNEQQDELWGEINALPQKSKEVIVLHFYAELTLEEVAVSLNIPVGTCKSRLHYALTKLRKNISRNDFLVEQKFKEGV
jgi:RNA polymerase sigma factor (sigma-70 family)